MVNKFQKVISDKKAEATGFMKKVISDKKIEATRLMNSEQFKKVSATIHTAAVASGAAGVIPIPAADAVPITAVQVSMVLALGKIFDRQITESVAKGLIGATSATFVGRNLVKLIPVFGWGVSGAVAAGVTEAVGWTIAVDLAKNAKKSWERDYPDKEQVIEVLEEEIAETETIIEELRKRASQFLSDGKTSQNAPEEYQKLLNDIEAVMSDLPENDPLCRDYHKISLLF